MHHLHENTRSEILTAVCHELLALAKCEDDTAADEASVVPYWAPLPASVDGHRAAARTLRQAAHEVEAEVRARTTAPDILARTR